MASIVGPSSLGPQRAASNVVNIGLYFFCKGAIQAFKDWKAFQARHRRTPQTSVRRGFSTVTKTSALAGQTG
jgi:hypothetical protein